MCGIVGYVGDNLGEELLLRLLASIHHRGPDGDGRYHDGPVHMGMRRLSIIDLAHGWQPLLSREGQVLAFQNGEIYNYRALRAELERAGFVFKTHSDTEVLAHGYVRWGIDGLLARIDGMYAIAIYDRDSRELHLARDRFGEKPLFYTAVPGRFGYGSTLLAVSALPWVTDEFDPQALDHFLALHFVPGDRTVLAGVRQLLPGERLTVALDTLAITRQRYYIPPLEAPRYVSDDELANALDEAVISRLVADVPVGVFLSGGLDSSLVAALAARAIPSVATFSMGFSEAQVDESAHAAAVARHIGSTHHCFAFDQDDFMTLLPEVAAALDTPIGDQATLPVYWLSREARKHVSVVLAGEGADEVFAGYSYYRQFTAPASRGKRGGLLASLLTRRRASLARPERFLLDDPLVTPSGFPLLTSRAERHRLICSPLNDDTSDSWQSGFLDWLGGAHGSLQQATAADIATWLPDDLLVKFDRMAMAHGLEGRAPFLHPRLVALGLAMRSSERMAGESKVALRRIARRYLPDNILQRPKQGFVLPMRRWIGEWFAAWGGAGEYFSQRPIPGINGKELIGIVENDITTGLYRERLHFAVIMLAEWWHYFSAKRAALRYDTTVWG
ncbi:asparagine synthase [Acidithiobacillus caldus SM-1]|uniref:asparagine synthase (glutamine-hydrolyzing) n=1 Tax=Acidithiobacillus caldus (strain SM-1) TaxID=990288 RepID=F9ZLU9_ACICS|nr:asparagine synthase (glutamine-hydrolyzing) [Acidithiobacillus caldus]AEK57431.1 asparagine synthase [Acidithiobacillus caldus SM-1]